MRYLANEFPGGMVGVHSRCPDLPSELSGQSVGYQEEAVKCPRTFSAYLDSRTLPRSPQSTHDNCLANLGASHNHSLLGYHFGDHVHEAGTVFDDASDLEESGPQFSEEIAAGVLFPNAHIYSLPFRAYGRR